MSEKEQVVRLLDEIPEYKLGNVIAYIQGIIAGANNSLPKETMAAFGQIENGDLETFDNTDELFKSWEN